MPAAVLLLTLVIAAPAEDEELARRAETAFAEGVRLRDRPAAARPKFREAAEHYESLRQRGYRNAELYRSQGNAYLLADDLPRAILAYRRGRLLDPTDRGLSEGLQAARQKVHHSPDALGRPPADERPPWLPRLSLTAWTGAGLLLWYVVCCVCVLRWTMTRRGLWLGFGTAGLVLGVSASGFLAWTTYQEQGERRAPLVVVADEGVLLRKGNGLAYPPRSETPLPRGAEARLRHERDGWVQIELSDGTLGWVLREYVLIDRDE